MAVLVSSPEIRRVNGVYFGVRDASAFIRPLPRYGPGPGLRQAGALAARHAAAAQADLSEPGQLEFNVLFCNDALNQSGIDIKPVILAHLAETCGPRLQPPRAA
jgi:hypothetical protein